MVFNATFNSISVISGGQFYWWRKSEYPEKTTGMPKVIDKLYRMMSYRGHLAHSIPETHRNNRIIITNKTAENIRVKT